MTWPDRYKYGVIAVAETLHGHATGSGDSLPDDELRELRDWLQRRLDDWGPRREHERCAYDAAVYSLASAALDLVALTRRS